MTEKKIEDTQEPDIVLRTRVFNALSAPVAVVDALVDIPFDGTEKPKSVLRFEFDAAGLSPAELAEKAAELGRISLGFSQRLGFTPKK
jgi:hypothetical protein